MSVMNKSRKNQGRRILKSSVVSRDSAFSLEQMEERVLLAAVTVKVAPINEWAPVGGSVTFAATASGTATAQWKVSADNGTTFTNVTLDANDVVGTTATVNEFTLTVSNVPEHANDYKYEVVFTGTGSTSGTVTSTPATLVVSGTPIAQWNFTTGQAATRYSNGTSNNPSFPTPTLAVNNASAQTLGLINDYTGVQAFPEADIHAKVSANNALFAPYSWRIRSGNGGGATGNPGTPEGWSQYAPDSTYLSTHPAETFQYGNTVEPQGVQFAVDTTGYQNVTLDFNWNAGGIIDLQPQYTTNINANPVVWTNVPSSKGSVDSTGKVENLTGDFYNVTKTEFNTGVLIDLRTVGAANNDANFGIRLVTKYAPTTVGTYYLPAINDGNLLINDNSGNNGTGNPIPHGQYAKGIGAANAMQVLTFGNGTASNVSGGTFTLTFGGQTTAAITYSSNPTTMAASIQTALASLSTLGTGNVTVIPHADTTNTRYEVNFVGTKAKTAIADLTFNAGGLSGTGTLLSEQTWQPGGANVAIRYVDGGGAWELSNITVNGDTVSGAPGIAVQPTSATVVHFTTPSVTTSQNTFTATAYSTTNTTAQWFTGPNINNLTPIGGATNISSTGTNLYTSTYTTPTSLGLADDGTKYWVQFTNSVSTSTTLPATLYVVIPSSPVVTVQPFSRASLVGRDQFFFAAATANPAPTIQWQSSTDGFITHNVVSTTANSHFDSTNNTLTLTNLNMGQDGTQYRAAFTNATGTVYSNVVTLSVLPTELRLAGWNFDGTGPNQGSFVSPYNNPAPTGSTLTTTTPTATALNMNQAYSSIDAATGDGVTAFGSAADCDVNSQASPYIAGFSENTWRVRGGPLNALGTAFSGAAGTPGNGWSNFAAAGTQGAQWQFSTVGYSKVYFQTDWYATQSGVRDLQGQYSTDGGVTWTNAGSLYEGNPIEDYYGVYETGYNNTNNTNAHVIPLVFDMSHDPTAQNNPIVLVRVVSEYSPYLPQITDALGQTHGQYANTAPNTPNDPTTVVPYNGSKGNWRFGNIELHGVPMFVTDVSTNPTLSWNPTTASLGVTSGQVKVTNPTSPTTVIPVTVTNTGTVEVAAGTPVTNISGITGTGNLLIDAGASLTTNTITQTGLTVNGSLAIPDKTHGGNQIELGSVDASGNTTTAGLLIIARDGNNNFTGKIDLADRLMKIHYTQSSTAPALTDGPADYIDAALAQGRNVAPGGVFDGPWTGSGGIVSSTAAQQFAAANAATGSPNTEFYAVGYGDTGKMTLQDGTITNKMLIDDAGTSFFDPAANGGRGAGIGSTVFLRYTRVGDASMDGIVGNNDVTVLGLNFDPTYNPAVTGIPKHWYDGNFNYNGVVDNNDVTILGLQFDPTNTTAVPTVAQAATPAAPQATTPAAPQITTSSQVVTASSSVPAVAAAFSVAPISSPADTANADSVLGATDNSLTGLFYSPSTKLLA